MLRLHRKPIAPSVALTKVVLDDQSEGAGADRVWVQVAAEGEFKGYAGGEMSFSFDTRTFEKIINNFRQHPNYTKGVDGYGSENVIAWDFHHASELDPTSGTVPQSGAPAQGWIQELSLRYGNEGKAELWALTKWLEPAKTYIKNEQYQWASVSVVFDAVDAVTGEKIGPILTSVALTNQPFIEGMNKLTASKKVMGGRYLEGRSMYLEPAETPEKALEMIRCMLGLPETADAAGVMAELEKVKQWSLTGAQPLGVDLEEIIGGLRCVLNLPSLSTNEEVFAEVDKLVARLLGTDTVDGGVPPLPEGSPETPAPPGSPAPMMEKNQMELLKIIAEKLGVVAQLEVVKEAVDQLIELRMAAADKVGLEKTASTKVILKATMDDASVRAKYGPILQALGVEDPTAALDKIANLMSESAKLAEMAPEFAQLKVKAAEYEEEEQTEEVEEAMSTTGVTAESPHYAGLKIALTHMRKHDKATFDAQYGEKIKAAKKAKADAAKAGANPALLTTTIVATGGQPASPGGAGGGAKISLVGFAGRNITERAMAYCCKERGITLEQAQKDHSLWQQIHQTASNLVSSGAVAD